MKKNVLLICLSFLLLCGNVSGQNREKIQNGTILQCWCWSFKTIEENIPAIAEAGFTAIQTSPANTCVVGENGGLSISSKDGTGNWFYHYQPTDWKIGNYQMGTREEFVSMCKKAEEYGLCVLVDVLPNHTTTELDQLAPEFVEAVGGLDKMFHKNSDHNIRGYSDRLECTTAKMGGLPDVNTESPLFQAYFMEYIKELISLGVDGFRYDTAKHIGLPDDPKDEYSPENDFWPVFTGRKALNGETLDCDDLFMYGEILQATNSREGDYAEFIGVTANNYGAMIRSAVKNRKLSAKGLPNWNIAATADKLVTWVESHDTYANEGETAGLTNEQIRLGWAIITARAGGTPLFFNRPQGQEATQFPNASKIGDIGNDQFMHPEVAAVNKFRTAMVGEDETFINPGTTGVLVIKRGEKGAVIINAGAEGSTKISFEIGLPNGTYKDKAHNIKCKVKKGVATMTIPAGQVAVIY